MSGKLKVILEKEPGGGYSAHVPSLPGCASQGETLEETLTNIREAVELYLEGLKADNVPVPPDTEILVREVEYTV